MRTILAVICSLALTLTGLGVAAAETPDAPPTIAADNTTTATGRAVYVSNSLYSTGSIKMCTGHDGTGTCYTVPRNSKSPAPVRSVYGQRFCLTMVNSSYVPEGGYWNSKWYSWGPHAAVKIC